jgi:anti-sigma factor RsiW
MRSLSEEEVEAFEVHYFACPACATLLEQTDEYLDAMRRAAGNMQTDAQQPASRNLGHGSN